MPVPVIASLAWIASVSPAPAQRAVHRREDLIITHQPNVGVGSGVPLPGTHVHVSATT